jgi:hypothetical protein
MLRAPLRERQSEAVGNSMTVRWCSAPRPHWGGLLRAAAMSGIFLSATLAGCALGPGQFSVDPDHYEFYHCNDLVKDLKTLEARESELRSLMARASEGGGGAVIGELSYRVDYETVLTQEKMLKRVAAEKCAKKSCRRSHHRSRRLPFRATRPFVDFFRLEQAASCEGAGPAHPRNRHTRARGRSRTMQQSCASLVSGSSTDQGCGRS